MSVHSKIELVFWLQLKTLLSIQCKPQPINATMLTVSTSFLDQVIQGCYHRHHLLEMLIKVNKRIADEQRGNPNGGITVQVPYLTHTLRAKVHLGMNHSMKRIIYDKSVYVKRRILRMVVE